jgi:hypothetical protein
MRIATGLVLVFALFSQGALAQTPPLLPRFVGETIPDPPARRDPWTPPATKLPRFLVEATATLCEQGLADPRGCEYRSILLELEPNAPALADVEPPSLHGWVMPAKVQGGPRFAVGWDGLVYPLAAIGPVADLDLDIQMLIEAREQAMAAEPSEFRYRSFQSEPGRGIGSVVSQDYFGPMKVILLLRLGRADLAERVWATSTGWTPDRGKFDLTRYGVSYLTLASDWAWSQLDRGIRAHSHKEDPLALASLHELARICPLIEAKALEMGFPRRIQESGIQIAGVPPEVRIPPYLDFLGPFPALLADQERRAKEPPAEADIAKIADQSARIKALIRSFDQVDGSNLTTIFGHPDLAESPVIKALIEEGDAAIEPLLDCLEHDDRLTRLISRDNRHDNRYFSLGTVSDVAYTTLLLLLDLRGHEPRNRVVNPSTGDCSRRAALAAEIRARLRDRTGR